MTGLIVGVVFVAIVVLLVLVDRRQRRRKGTRSLTQAGRYDFL